MTITFFHCPLILACLKLQLDPQFTEVSRGLHLASEGFGSVVSAPQDKDLILWIYQCVVYIGSAQQTRWVCWVRDSLPQVHNCS